MTVWFVPRTLWNNGDFNYFHRDLGIKLATFGATFDSPYSPYVTKSHHNLTSTHLPTPPHPTSLHPTPWWWFRWFPWWFRWWFRWFRLFRWPKNIGVFLSENFQFWEMKFSIYLNRRVFVMASLTTVFSTSLGMTFFALRFILHENILFWMTISYQKPFVFSVSVFCSQICTLKLNLGPKNDLAYAISIVNWLLEFFIKTTVFMFLCRIWIIDFS